MYGLSIVPLTHSVIAITNLPRVVARQNARLQAENVFLHGELQRLRGLVEYLFTL